MALLIYFLIYFTFAFIWRSVLVYRRTGKNPFVLPSGDDAYGYVGRAFKFVIAAVAFIVAVNATAPGLLPPLGACPALQIPSLRVFGWALLLAALAWTLVAQAQMGDSWRIGIDSANSTALVTSGLFAISRNPIFLAMRINLLGLFAVLPNALTLLTLIAGEMLMQVQVRLEETHLAGLHAEQYAQYRKRVRRWL
ncbi:MAG: isoprenylcysteine carboxylmethyltransferase family protein [Gammaproteobacteria bacterium]|nr:isoprenylcysteine carboxylmethyltransferase family protein [Gammaproteobacteria bacterium]MBK9666146.1 isoprenylcysteine carboxylmethyltransferase family protein [Gammaproteobacteria bacterium]